MFKLLRNVRKVYKQWKSLPADKREQFGDDIHQIRRLVRELGGSRALEFIESDGEPQVTEGEEDSIPNERDRAAVIAELKDATSALLSKMAVPAGQLAADSAPRSIRLGGRAVSAGVRRIGRKREL